MPTPLSTSEAQEILARALGERTAPDSPTPNQLALVWAQSALETANWQSMHGFNFGNVIATSQWLEDGKPTIELNDSGNMRLFRVYPDALTGARDYVGTLWRRPERRAGLLSGHPATFARALKVPPAYYEASLERYLGTLVPLWRQFGGRGGATVAQGSTVLALIAVLAFGAIAAKRLR